MLRESQADSERLAELNASHRARGFEKGMHFVMDYDDRVAAQGPESAYEYARSMCFQAPRAQHPLDRLIGLDPGFAVQVPRTPSPVHIHDEIPATPLLQPIPQDDGDGLDVVPDTPPGAA
jgi:hypothetical protein